MQNCLLEHGGNALTPGVRICRPRAPNRVGKPQTVVLTQKLASRMPVHAFFWRRVAYDTHPILTCGEPGMERDHDLFARLDARHVAR